MADSPKDSDQSMEDILQSIKRIIADENEAPPAAPTGSDVLELTDLLAEDVAVPAAPPSPEPPPPAPEPVPEPPAVSDVGTLSIDEIMATPTPPAPVVEPEHSPNLAREIPPSPVPEPEPSAPVGEDIGSLMSESAVSAAAAAMSALAHRPSRYVGHDSPVFRSGVTVEDLVLETLRPMLKEWLDNNLPAMVRQLVEREIRRISGSV